MLKLGGLSCELDSQISNIPHQVSLDKANPLRNIEAKNNELPFISKAFDVCIMANQLDYTEDPHRLLREIDRIMIDDGYLLKVNLHWELPAVRVLIILIALMSLFILAAST